jgi:RNA polymerase sigma-70 factor (ECF subfamily)
MQQINEETASQEFEYNELENALAKVIEDLPRCQKEVYLLHRNEGLKYSEIAKRSRISINTVENHMSRALKTIRQKLAGYNKIIVFLCYFF